MFRPSPSTSPQCASACQAEHDQRTLGSPPSHHRPTYPPQMLQNIADALIVSYYYTFAIHI